MVLKHFVVANITNEGSSQYLTLLALFIKLRDIGRASKGGIISKNEAV